MVAIYSEAAAVRIASAGLAIAGFVTAGMALAEAPVQQAIAVGKIRKVHYVGDPSEQVGGLYQGQAFYGGVFRVTLSPVGTRRGRGRKGNLQIDLIAAQQENLKRGRVIYVVYRPSGGEARGEYWGTLTDGRVCAEPSIVAKFHLEQHFLGAQISPEGLCRE